MTLTPVPVNAPRAQGRPAAHPPKKKKGEDLDIRNPYR
jgi:hypothetical protein